jgi:hypothetical protein
MSDAKERVDQLGRELEEEIAKQQRYAQNNYTSPMG